MTDHEIEDEVAQGATSIEELTIRCGAGAECGGCWPALQELLEKALWAIQDAAIRAGFMVGLARGTAFASLLAQKALGKPQRTQQGGRRTRRSGIG